MSPAVRCVLLVGTVPGLESFKNPLLGSICHHTVGFTMARGVDDHHALAVHLRELADILEAPTVEDHDLV